MITTVKLINTSITSRSYLYVCVCVCVCVCREHLRSTLSEFQVYNTVLLTKVTKSPCCTLDRQSLFIL